MWGSKSILITHYPRVPEAGESPLGSHVAAQLGEALVEVLLLGHAVSGNVVDGRRGGPRLRLRLAAVPGRRKREPRSGWR